MSPSAEREQPNINYEYYKRSMRAVRPRAGAPTSRRTLWKPWQPISAFRPRSATRKAPGPRQRARIASASTQAPINNPEAWLNDQHGAQGGMASSLKYPASAKKGSRCLISARRTTNCSGDATMSDVRAAVAGIELGPNQEALLPVASVLAYDVPLHQLSADQVAALRLAMSAASQAQEPAPVELQQVAAAASGADLATALPLLQQLRRTSSDALERASRLLYGRPVSALMRQQLCELVPAVAEVVG